MDKPLLLPSHVIDHGDGIYERVWGEVAAADVDVRRTLLGGAVEGSHGSLASAVVHQALARRAAEEDCERLMELVAVPPLRLSRPAPRRSMRNSEQAAKQRLARLRARLARSKDNPRDSEHDRASLSRRVGRAERGL